MGVESIQWFFATHTQTVLNVLKLQWPVIVVVVVVVVTASCGQRWMLPCENDRLEGLLKWKQFNARLLHWCK